MMYDEPTQYFRKYSDTTDTNDYDDYYYNGYGDSSYRGPYGYNNEPSYSYTGRYNRGRNYDPKYIPPYDPTVQSQCGSRYPQTYHDPYQNSYDYYDNHPRYTSGYQQRMNAQEQIDKIPPYEPEVEARKCNHTGLLNSDLFRNKEGYSNPFAQRYERKYVPPTNSVYSKSNPIVGGVCNNFTRPPVPRDPHINWEDCLSRDKTRNIDPYANIRADYTDPYDYAPAPAPKIEESWYDTAKRNFPTGDDN